MVRDEVQIRKLYLDMAYPSLFEFCVKELKYSASAAYRRIEAMRLLKSLPDQNQTQIKAKIISGSLNLTHLTAAQSFLKHEKKNEKSYSAEKKTELLEKLESKSKLEVEKELIRISPQYVPSRGDTLRQISEDKFECNFEEKFEGKVEGKLFMSAQLVAKLEELKALKSHVNPHFQISDRVLLRDNRSSP